VILAGDVGGTSTRLARFGGDDGRPEREWVGRSADHESLAALVRTFLGSDPPPEIAVFGIAGPVVGNACDATNLAWRVDGDALGRALGIRRVLLVNDLVATAHGLAVLPPDDLEILQAGTALPGNRALIAAGTGLGQAVLAPDGSGWTPLATEGGHADFAPGDPVEDQLLVWLRARHGHVSWERVLSGPGLADLYRFHAATGRGEEPEGFAARFAAAPDPAALVSEAARGDNPRARLVIERFVSLYGAQAGNLALQSLALGGVYVGGGIAPRILPFLRAGGFLTAFRAKGRFAPLLATIPVTVMLDDRAALWGAAAVARSLAGRTARTA
jgi:glucokinase